MESDGPSGCTSCVKVTHAIPQVWQHMENSRANMKQTVKAFTYTNIPFHVFQNEAFKNWITTATYVYETGSQ